MAFLRRVYFLQSWKPQFLFCSPRFKVFEGHLESLGKYHFFRQLWLVLGVKLMEINSNWFSRHFFLSEEMIPGDSSRDLFGDGEVT